METVRYDQNLHNHLPPNPTTAGHLRDRADDFAYNYNARASRLGRVLMTSKQQGNFRPEEANFEEQMRWLTRKCGINTKKGEFLLAQRLSAGTEVANLIENPGLLEEYVTKHSGGVVPGYRRTAEAVGPCDSVIVPGRNFAQLRSVGNGTEAHTNFVENFRGFGISNADCPHVIISDTKDRVHAAVHGALNTLIDQNTGESGLVKVLEWMLSQGVKPEDLQIEITPGVGPCCYGLSEDHFNQVKAQIDRNWLPKNSETEVPARRATTAIAALATSSPLTNKPNPYSRTTKGPRKNQHGLDLYALIKLILADKGVKDNQIHTLGECSACKAGGGKCGCHSGVYRAKNADSVGGVTDNRRNFTFVEMARRGVAKLWN